MNILDGPFGKSRYFPPCSACSGMVLTLFRMDFIWKHNMCDAFSGTWCVIGNGSWRWPSLCIWPAAWWAPRCLARSQTGEYGDILSFGGSHVACWCPTSSLAFYWLNRNIPNLKDALFYTFCQLFARSFDFLVVADANEMFKTVGSCLFFFRNTVNVPLSYLKRANLEGCQDVLYIYWKRLSVSNIFYRTPFSDVSLPETMIQMLSIIDLKIK